MIARAFIRQDPYIVWGNGEQIRNWTNVKDIVRGTRAWIETLRRALLSTDSVAVRKLPGGVTVITYAILGVADTRVMVPVAASTVTVPPASTNVRT